MSDKHMQNNKIYAERKRSNNHYNNVRYKRSSKISLRYGTINGNFRNCNYPIKKYRPVNSHQKEI